MTCDQDMRVLVSSCADGQVSPEEERRARLHLAECGECRARVEEWGKLGELFQWAYTMDLPEVEIMAVPAETARAERPGRWVESLRSRLALRQRWAFGIAGAAVVAAMLVALFTWQASWPPLLAANLRTGAQASVVRMEHGVRLEVAPNSVVTRLGTDAIRLEAGSVRAIVEHGRRRFRVQAPRLEVTDLGTTFRVGTGMNGDVVVVEEGSVSVRTARNEQTVGASQAFLARDGHAPEVFETPPPQQGEDDKGLPLYDPSIPFAPEGRASLDWRDRAQKLVARFPDARYLNGRLGGESTDNGRIYGYNVAAARGLRIGLRAHFADIALFATGGPVPSGTWEIPCGYLQVDGISTPVSLPPDLYLVRLRKENDRLVWTLSSATGDTDLPVVFAPGARPRGGSFSESNASDPAGGLRVNTITRFERNGRTDELNMFLKDFQGPLTPMLRFRMAGISLAEEDPAAHAMLEDACRRFGLDPTSVSQTTLYLDPQRRHRLMVLWKPGDDAAETVRRGARRVWLGAIVTDVPWREPVLPAGVYGLWWSKPGAGAKARFEIESPESSAGQVLPESPSAGGSRSSNPGRGEFGATSWSLSGWRGGAEPVVSFQSMGPANGAYRFRLAMSQNGTSDEIPAWGEGWLSVKQP